ncbi:MAG: transposase [Gemmatimonadota bacterium]|nr:transposase [Gemmatimonadota bacterium]MDQ3520987.1 transposase [Gemmatimonadota bacterium]
MERTDSHSPRGLALLARRGMRTLENALEDSLTFYRFPRERWKMLRTNNPLERLTQGDPEMDQGGRAVPA